MDISEALTQLRRRGRGTPSALPAPAGLRLGQVLVSDDDYVFLRYGRRT